MKIFFNGCSFTWGTSLKDPFNHRYSKHICDYYHAEEINISKPGASNQRIIRTTILEEPKYDLAIIQLTNINRIEYYCDIRKKWIFAAPNIRIPNTKLSLQHSREVTYDFMNNQVEEEIDYKHSWHLRGYYKYAHSETNAMIQLKLVYESIKNFYIANNIPFVIISFKKLNSKPPLSEEIIKNLDLYFNFPNNLYYEEHPTSAAHKIISEKIIECIHHKYPQFDNKR